MKSIKSVQLGGGNPLNVCEAMEDEVYKVSPVGRRKSTDCMRINTESTN